MDGHTNYSVWKERMQSIFEEAEVWDIMVHTAQQPVNVPTDATLLAAYNRKNNKGKRLILDGIKDHCIPHVRGKRNAHEMWSALTNLYQSTNENRKMVLKEKLKIDKERLNLNKVNDLTTQQPAITGGSTAKTSSSRPRSG